jgi:hypothetical protein
VSRAAPARPPVAAEAKGAGHDFSFAASVSAANVHQKSMQRPRFSQSP